MTTTVLASSPHLVARVPRCDSRLESLADLILARLIVPTKTSPGAKKIHDDVSVLFDRPPSREEFDTAIASLHDGGFVTLKPMRLTSSGRQRTLAYLGTTEFPSRCPWSSLLAKFLIPRALQVAPSAKGTLAKIAKADGLASILLKRKLQLNIGAGASLHDVLESLACRELGFPDLNRLADVKNIILSRWLGADRPLDAEQLSIQIPRVKLNAPKKGIEGLRLALIREWLQSSDESAGETPPPIAEPGFDLAAFAHTVQAVARDCPTGRLGENRVFINHVWRRLVGEVPFQTLQLATFKRHLLDATMADLIVLTRADLVQVVNPDDIRESTTVRENAEYHFVLIEKELS